MGTVSYTDCDWCGHRLEGEGPVHLYKENSYYPGSAQLDLKAQHKLPYPPVVCKACRVLMYDGNFSELAIRHEMIEYAKGEVEREEVSPRKRIDLYPILLTAIILATIIIIIVNFH